VARCVTCGGELHPERAEKYDYCTLPSCQAQNARGLTIVGVGVNKAAEQFVIPTERAKKEMAGGKYQDPRRGSFGGYERPPAPGEATTNAEAGRDRLGARDRVLDQGPAGSGTLVARHRTQAAERNREATRGE
jgi:hypothetical protein